MKDLYFRWEREASIHLLFPTLEGSMKALEDFTGHSYPTTILIFKNGIVTWTCREDEFYKLGEKLLRIYKDPNKEKEMLVQWAKRLDELKRVEKEIDKINLGKLTVEKLANLYYRLHDTFVDYYTVGAIHEPLAMEAEKQLKASTSLSDDQVSHITSPTKISFIKEAENYLLEKGIEAFIEKFFWIDNNYSGTKVLSKEDAKKRLDHIKIDETTRSLNSKTSNLTEEEKRLVELLRNFGGYQDERKRNILIYLHFLEILLKEIGKRGNISMQSMRDTFPEEVEDILNGKITEDFIIKIRGCHKSY